MTQIRNQKALGDPVEERRLQNYIHTDTGIAYKLGVKTLTINRIITQVFPTCKPKWDLGLNLKLISMKPYSLFQPVHNGLYEWYYTRATFEVVKQYVKSFPNVVFAIQRSSGVHFEYLYDDELYLCKEFVTAFAALQENRQYLLKNELRDETIEALTKNML